MCPPHAAGHHAALCPFSSATDLMALGADQAVGADREACVDSGKHLDPGALVDSAAIGCPTIDELPIGARARGRPVVAPRRVALEPELD